MLGRQKLLLPGLLQDALEKPNGNLRADQPLLVLREARMVPDRFIEGHAQKPAEQDAVADLFGEHPVAADRVQGLQDERLQKLLRGDRGPARVGVHPIELGRQAVERRIHHHPDRAQRVIRRNEILGRQINEHGVSLVVDPAHRKPPGVLQGCANDNTTAFQRADEDDEFFNNLLVRIDLMFTFYCIK